MSLQVPAIGNEASGAFDVSDEVFGQEFNETLVHQLVTKYLSAARAGTKAQKKSLSGQWWRYEAF